MRSARLSPDGSRARRWASAGTAAIAGIATTAAAASSSPACAARSPASRMTAATGSTWSPPPARSRSCPQTCRLVEAAPLMCAGLTTFNALRNSGARPGDVVAVLGLGGLGHLGVQYAAKMGFHTVGIARGKDKEPLARQLGASVYIDSQAQDPAAELVKLGGAKVILATATSGEAMSAVQGGLAVNGTLLIVGAAESMQVSPLSLLMGCRSVKGWYSGTSIDSQDTLAFSVRAGVRSMNETYPLDRVSEAYDRMMSGKARFRVVLAIGE